ncbi:TetR/AcrR family transcriptional regulator [Fructobacillus sp. M158]|nr:TetR/AcrR family transcriptional regulator [Fructobacillus parabroussonetiae]MCK8617578.1 TetR/AcrR family transcriptional regulator [Fructobacillus parabroussonetiae]
MIKKTDRRFSKADQAIRQSFLALLEKENFDKISVKRIIDQAGINRSTFYAHYLDKFDLMEKIPDELLDQLIDALPTVDWSANSCHLVPLERSCVT